MTDYKLFKNFIRRFENGIYKLESVKEMTIDGVTTTTYRYFNTITKKLETKVFKRLELR